MFDSNHPKISKALENYGVEKFCNQADKILDKNPFCRVVLGLLGGPSTGRYGFSHTAGKNYPRYAVRYTRKFGLEGIERHAGPYLYISL